MKPKFRAVLLMAIEEGVRYGYNRAHKHTENPTANVVMDHITQNVMDCIDEWFDFDKEDE